MSDEVAAAVAAGVLSAEERFRALLQSIVEVARAIFGAKAASIFLHDEETDELVFEAVAGEGEGTLVGRRFPSSTGVAGFVLISRQPLIVEDVAADPRFSREAASSTGFVPHALMAVPLLAEERALGVLEVLDLPHAEQFSFAEMELLGLFAAQAAIALEVLGHARRAREAADARGDLAALARLGTRLDALEPERRTAALRLLDALDQLLS